MKDIALGIDIGGSHIVCATVDIATGKVDESTKAHQDVDNAASKDEILDAWAATINESVNKMESGNLIGYGFAMPGAFNYKEGIALFEGNEKFKNLYGVNVPLHLNPRLVRGDLPIKFLNDATSFAVGECWYGKAKGFEKVISLTLGTGFGSAFIVDGVPVIDHPEVPKEGCLWYLPFDLGIADEYFSTRWFVKEYFHKTGEHVKGAKEVAEMAREGDTRCIDMITKYGKNLAIFLMPWLHKFSPDVVMVGGNISGAFDLFSRPCGDMIYKEGILTQLVSSDLKENAALMGAACLFKDDFWKLVKDNLPTL